MAKRMSNNSFHVLHSVPGGVRNLQTWNLLNANNNFSARENKQDSTHVDIQDDEDQLIEKKIEKNKQKYKEGTLKDTREQLKKSARVAKDKLKNIYETIKGRPTVVKH